ncbi:metalloregulator ArsR/SmtB family transcription factor [Flavobacterium sp. 17A]|uniref:Metalloregulator ArsR/SmtB family transcription factor n=1 Tax=Flavobacterium potami TaxID=2872310 RepID=A0A9X1HBH4_9FLAO|nr:metalloregulator ArsR/SmtB family transcription factor [Flavobacterium potami]MBZ4035685.1 metalloregulator ArsR/SmtB family transcription factor [Flavobacterium potami]
MGISKHLKFDSEIDAISTICKALGHAVRIQIMTLLWKRDNRTCGELVELIPLAQSTISKHLLELKKAGLVRIKNEGKKTIYSVEIDSIQIIKKYFSCYLSTIEIAEKNKTTVLTTKLKVGKNSHLKQYNYQFSHKKVTEKHLNFCRN